MRHDVTEFCRSCIPCQRNKSSNRKPLGLLQPADNVPWRPWSVVCMDFITRLPKSIEGYDAILVVIDMLSKRAHFIPTTSDASAAKTAQIFFDSVWKYHGLPTRIISDRDSKFTSGFWTTLWKLLGTKLALSTAFSPQTDGLTERLNRTLEEYIRAYIDPLTGQWAQLLTPAEYAYNASVQASIGMSPFEADCGLRPNNPLYMFSNAARVYSNGRKVINSLEDFLEQMKVTWGSARRALELAQQNQKLDYDHKRRYDEFKVGDKVYMSSQRLQDGTMIQWGSKAESMVNKFQPRYLGPFSILSKVSGNAYKLDLPSGFKIHPVINIRYLSRENTSDKFPERNEGNRLPPILVNNEPLYRVEAIVKKRLRKRGKAFEVQYLTKWLGYPHEESTWEPVTSFQDFPELIRDFEANANSVEVLTYDFVYIPDFR